MTRRRLQWGTFWLLVSGAGSAMLSFALAALIARALGEDGLGLYATALAWVFPLSILAEFGLGTLMVRDLARAPADTPAYLRSGLILRLLMGGGLGLLLLVAAPLLTANAALVTALQLSAPLLFITPTFNLFSAVFRAQQAMWPIPALNLGMLLMQVIVTAAVLSGGGSITSVIVVNTLTSAAQLAAAAWLYQRQFAPNHPTSTTSDTLAVGTLLQRSWPFALAGLLGALHLRAGTLLLEQMAPLTQVGYLAMATRFADAGRLLPTALYGALMPVMAASSTAPARGKVMWLLGGYGALVGAGGLALGGAVVQWAFGAAFLPGVTALHISLWSLAVSAPRGLRMAECYSVGLERRANRTLAVGLAALIGCSLLLIPAHSATGAAVAMLFSEIIMLALLWR